jgi:hypothetical protein
MKNHTLLIEGINQSQHLALLDTLSEPFIHEEIDVIVANLPSDRSPGPDRFSTDFVKKCWPIIK